ncbi:peroxidase 40 [Tripterygium wilfordii]|uniref:peroxidase 40 n=1 Tax=Tripterygium wilfordii TaxID=458696 RepID=UPI0018F7EF2B|nr:peroxidase 40 [Tripterygium wilfordii]
MGLCLALLFLILKLAIVAFAVNSSTSTLKEDCVDDIVGGVVLQFNIYQTSCPEAEDIIFSWVEKAVTEEPRMAASLLRLHFHDCFVNGCDASVLLDDSGNFVGEKTAPPNLNSLRGFEVIDAIKSDMESVCPETVSCADILAVVARDSVVLSGGPGWEVQMGRRDSLSANKAAATNNIPAPNSTVPILLTKFQNVGLSLTDVVALSGAHTMGKARCAVFSSRLGGGGSGSGGGAEINLDFIQSLQQLCSEPDSSQSLAQLDLVTPATFDNQYFVNLLSGEGLLPSDQALVTDDDQTRNLVQMYAEDLSAFFEDFKNSMLRMGSLGVLTGNSGEIRRDCRTVN